MILKTFLSWIETFVAHLKCFQSFGTSSLESWSITHVWRFLVLIPGKVFNGIYIRLTRQLRFSVQNNLWFNWKYCMIGITVMPESPKIIKFQPLYWGRSLKWPAISTNYNCSRTLKTLTHFYMSELHRLFQKPSWEFKSASHAFWIKVRCGEVSGVFGESFLV